MCIPVAAAAGIAAGASLFGAFQSASAAKQSAKAIAAQNAADQLAQTEGFTSRLAATRAQTEAQKEAFTSQMGSETQIADAMRARQEGAITQQQDILGTLNQGEAGLRGIGYGAADNLIGGTSGDNLAKSQTDWNTQARTLLDASGVPALSGAATPGGTGNDPYVAASLARRAAEAASNIRSYGAKASQVASYAAPLHLTQNAIQDTATGIMPAQMASKLLTTSAPIVLQPSQTAWGNAENYGGAAIGAAEQAGQAGQNIANLQYANSTDIANLNQQNKETTAANVQRQAEADAQYKAAMGGVISGIGNLGLQAAGYYGKLPGFLDKFPAPVPQTPNPASIKYAF